MVSDEGERPEWLDLTRAAAYLGIKSRTLLRVVDGGALPAYRAGRITRFRRADLDAWRAVHMAPQPEPEPAVVAEVTQPAPDEDEPPPKAPRRKRRTWPRPQPDVEHVWAESQRPPEYVITEQAHLLAAFGEAWVDGVTPVPCPVCGRVFSRSDIAEHLREHRAEVRDEDPRG